MSENGVLLASTLLEKQTRMWDVPTIVIYPEYFDDRSGRIIRQASEMLAMYLQCAFESNQKASRLLGRMTTVTEIMDHLALLGDEALAMVHMPSRHLQLGLEKRHWPALAGLRPCHINLSEAVFRPAIL